jgi:hypothetical protein
MRVFLVTILLLFFFSVNAQRNLPFDSMMIKKHVMTLASDSFQGRGSFTMGEKLTVAYLTNYFKKLGLEPGNGKAMYRKFVLFKRELNRRHCCR